MFIGGNVAYSRFGYCGVHAHVHVEPREQEDPAWQTFSAHQNRRNLTEAEIAATQLLYCKLFRERFGDQFIPKADSVDP
jgi:diadenosine tetraphosphate (Ap4A) HIT family hydrolase